MKPIFQIFTFLLLNFSMYAQNRFRQTVDPQNYILPNQLNDFQSYDFSSVFVNLNFYYVQGVIGDDFQRIQVKIISAEKDTKNPNIYHLKGKSKVKNNIVPFSGDLTLNALFLIKDIPTEENLNNIAHQGVITGSYWFKEPKKGKHSGVFKGNYEGKFQISDENKVTLNDLDLFSDHYINNIFNGTWETYDKKMKMICKWGDFRVPDVPSTFDLGAGEFSPNEKYNTKGWGNYNNAFLRNNVKAIELEETEWWK